MAIYNVTLDQAWRLSSKLSQAQNGLADVLASIGMAQTVVDEVFGVGNVVLLSAQERVSLEALQQRWAVRSSQIRTATFRLTV